MSSLVAAAQEFGVTRSAVQDQAVSAGLVLGAYTLLRQIGQGGAGTVWLAQRTDGCYDAMVAIKMLQGGAAAHNDRFAREGRLLARLRHPHIANLLGAGASADDRLRYLVLEYVDGMPIDRYCSDQQLGVQATVRLLLDVLAAVAYAHGRLVLHRDIKPDNVLVTSAGQVKLLDFGIARLIEPPGQPGGSTGPTEATLGPCTPAYAAPEQMNGGELSTATDVYALGVLLYTLLCGSHPTARRGASALEIARSALEVEPVRMSQMLARSSDHAGTRHARELRGDLDTIAAKALKKHPEQRYVDAEHLADDLRRYLAGRPIVARSDSRAYTAGKFVRRNRAAVAGALAVVLAVTTAAVLALHQARQASLQRDQAEGLIEFMLGDLRRKLDSAGRLDVLDALGEKVLAHHGRRDTGRLSADALGQRARALHLIGEIAEKRGRLQDAEAVLKQAAESTYELTRRDPTDAARLFDHAQSVYWLGYVARRRGHPEAAETSFQQYRNLARQLRTLDPNKTEWRVEEAFAAVNLGVVYLDNARAAQALPLFEFACSTWADITTSRPDLHIERARALGWLSKAQESMGDYAGAIHTQRTKIDALSMVPGASTNRVVQRSLAASVHDMGRMHLTLGQTALAVHTAHEAVQRYEALVALDGSNLEWKAQLSFTRNLLAEALLASDRGVEARDHLRRAGAEIARLLLADARHKKWHIALRGETLLLHVKSAPIDEQLAYIDDLKDFLTSVQATEPVAVLDVDQTSVAAAAELLLGDLLKHTGQPSGAHQHWQGAVQRLQQPGAGTGLQARVLLAHALLRLGSLAEARAHATQVEQSTYRHPAYADLRQRLERAVGAAAAP